MGGVRAYHGSGASRFISLSRPTGDEAGAAMVLNWLVDRRQDTIRSLFERGKKEVAMKHTFVNDTPVTIDRFRPTDVISPINVSGVTGRLQLVTDYGVRHRRPQPYGSGR
jgi:hypothetical protein